jgi:hypothetical protein
MIDEPPVMMELRYVGGPIDNTIERRVVAPRLGEFVYRIHRGLYAKYVWDGSAFVFEELTP